jgi:DNA-binding MarR family transcriptional regulator
MGHPTAHPSSGGIRNFSTCIVLRYNVNTMNDKSQIGAVDYAALAEFRYQIRRFLRFSEEAARKSGIEPQQYQMLLAIKGLPEGSRARIGELAERLQIEHNSTVELINRLEGQDLVQRNRSTEDRREVIVSLTNKGEYILRELALHHRQQLRTAGPQLAASLFRAAGARKSAKDPGRRKVAPAGRQKSIQK